MEGCNTFNNEDQLQYNPPEVFRPLLWFRHLNPLQFVDLEKNRQNQNSFVHTLRKSHVTSSTPSLRLDVLSRLWRSCPDDAPTHIQLSAPKVQN